MENDRNQQQPGGASQPSKGTEDIVHQHLKDPNHVITDEDIRNVQVGQSEEIPTTGAELQARFSDDKEEGNRRIAPGEVKNTDEEDNFRPPNPWDVIK